MQRARYNGFVLEVYLEGVRWKYYIHDFDNPELDCFGTLESEDNAKKKAIKSAKIQGAKVGRFPSADPEVWVRAPGRSRKSTQTEAFSVAGSR
jgi:hypothetical protein